ncbi:hypothetical protein CVT25_003515 [Psilocybe cyanescens]|uniref:Uncharacterized protein n=1 Tax=Psilocybe cyanescens TaxID=93625 RepID=A0A409WP13_PSICY|nr:hypothetical protein CVT25_003515 [Psilocybe cyanescens]
MATLLLKFSHFGCRLHQYFIRPNLLQGCRPPPVIGGLVPHWNSVTPYHPRRVLNSTMQSGRDAIAILQSLCLFYLVSLDRPSHGGNQGFWHWIWHLGSGMLSRRTSLRSFFIGWRII